ncbi:tetratricopeptide repeat protein [bacterium]|nr:tetratricopeptide repeat protein [bacterium]
MRKKIPEICLLIIIFLVPIAVLKQAYNYVFIKFVIAQAMVFCVILLWIYNWLFQRRGTARRAPTGFPKGLISAFCLWCLASFFMAGNKLAGATELVNLFTYVLIYFVVLETCKSRPAFLRICFVWFLATFIAEVPTLLNRFSIPIIRDLPQLFGNPTFFAPYIVLCIPVILSFILYFWGNGWGQASPLLDSRLFPQTAEAVCCSPPPQPPALAGGLKLLLCCILVVTSIISLYKLEARAAWIGFCVSIVFFACAFIYLKWGLAKSFYLFIGVILLCAAVWQVRSESIMRVINKELLTGTIGIRKWIWLGSLNMFLASPFTGWGIGNFAAIYPQFRIPDYFLNPHAVNATRHVHCEALEIGCELGVVGLALFVGIIGSILLRGINTARNTDDRLKKYLLIGFISGVMGLLFENLGNVDLRFHSSGIFLWFALGCVSALSVRGTKAQRHKGTKIVKRLRVPIIILFSALLLFVFNYFSVNPLRAEVYFRKGVEYRNKKNWNKSIGMYKKTIRFNRGHLKAYYRLAFAYAKVGKIEDAFRVYYQLAELEPDYADIHYNLAKLYTSTKNYKKAVKELEIAVRMNPYSEKALMGLGNTYEKLRKLDKAIQQYKKAVKLNPDFGGAHNNLGNIYMMKREWDEAIKEYKIALRIMPKALGVARNLGVAYYKKGRYKEAKNIFKKILHIQPDNKQAQSYLEQITKVMSGQ